MVQREDSSAIASNPLQADEFLEADWIPGRRAARFALAFFSTPSA